MGIFKRTPSPLPSAAPVRSPWSEGQLQAAVLADALGTLDDAPLTRLESMRVPSVAKGRNLLVATIAPLPLRVLDVNGPIERQPTWTTRTDGLSPWHRMGGIVDDLIFYGGSLLWAERGADGYPLSLDRISPERWKATASGEIHVDSRAVPEENVVYVPGPHEGLLTLAARTIRGSRDIELAWVDRVRTPVALVEFRETGENNLTDQEIQAFVSAYKKARQAGNGAVGFTPQGFELVDHGTGDPKLFESGRNGVRVDIGAYLGIPSALMDSGVSSNNITYSTLDGQRSEYLTFTVPFWTAAIEGRLSMDDVVPRGQRVRLDMSDLLAPAQSPTGVVTED